MKQILYFLVCAAAVIALAGCHKNQGKTAKRGQADQDHPGRHRRRAATGATSSMRRPASFMMGNPNAKVKLIEIGALTCPHCREFEEQGRARPLVDKYVKSGQVSWEFRTY